MENQGKSLHFNGHFPGGPGLAGTRISPFWILLELRMMEVVRGDNWSYKTCKAPVISSPPTNQHPVLYRPDALHVAQPTVSKHWREKSDGKKSRCNQLTWVQLEKWLLRNIIGQNIRINVRSIPQKSLSGDKSGLFAVVACFCVTRLR